MPEEVKTRALKEIDRMSRIPSASPEVGVIRTYVDWLVGLPWTTSTVAGPGDGKALLDKVKGLGFTDAYFLRG